MTASKEKTTKRRTLDGGSLVEAVERVALP